MDMNHGWPNLGHDSFVMAVREAAEGLRPELEGGALRVRALSYEVRRRAAIPEGPGGRHVLYLGTGGPGHLDPRRNDGAAVGSQGVVEDPSWEEPLFRLFDAIRADHEAALLSVCHSFGVMCRWSGAAEPVLRGAEKGGKSAGVLDNVLSDEALHHPWFARLAAEAGPERRIKVVDHRLFDLLPRPGGGATPIGYETRGVGGPAGDALTMAEWAREEAGGLPRMFGVNHHPEILGRASHIRILESKRARGEVTEEWYRDRLHALGDEYSGESETLLRRTSEFTLLGPLRHHLARQILRRVAGGSRAERESLIATS
jgi:hypothetical protein